MIICGNYCNSSTILNGGKEDEGNDVEDSDHDSKVKDKSGGGFFVNQY